MVFRTCYFIACRRRKDGFRQRRDPQNAAAPAKMVSGSGRFRKTLPRSREDGFRQRQVPQNAAAPPVKMVSGGRRIRIHRKPRRQNPAGLFYRNAFHTDQ